MQTKALHSYTLMLR